MLEISYQLKETTGYGVVQLELVEFGEGKGNFRVCNIRSNCQRYQRESRVYQISKDHSPRNDQVHSIYVNYKDHSLDSLISLKSRYLEIRKFSGGRSELAFA